MTSLRWAIAVCLLLPHALVGQTQPELLRTHGNLDREVLVNVKAAQMAPEGLAVLTDPNPAVHVFVGVERIEIYPRPDWARMS